MVFVLPIETHCMVFVLPVETHCMMFVLPVETHCMVFVFTVETHCMVFVKFLPDDATQEALDELIPGSTSVVIARNDDGVQRK